MKKIFPTLFLFALVLSIPAIFLQKGLDTPEIRQMVSSFGLAAPIIFILAASITNVIPPIGVVPFWVTSILIFGYKEGFLLSYAANLVGNSFNFYIARILGRHAVKRIAGQEALVEINKLPHVNSFKNIFILRLVGGAASDYISYACGLSHARYSIYILATALSSLPSLLLGFLILGSVPLTSSVAIAGSIGVFYAINYASTLLLIPASIYLSKKHK